MTTNLDNLVAGESIIHERIGDEKAPRLYTGIERGPDMIANRRFVFLGRGLGDDAQTIYRMSVPVHSIVQEKGSQEYTLGEEGGEDSSLGTITTFRFPEDAGYTDLAKQLERYGL